MGNENSSGQFICKPLEKFSIEHLAPKTIIRITKKQSIYCHRGHMQTSK